MKIELDMQACTGCGRCADACRHGVLQRSDTDTHPAVRIARPEACRGCRACERACREHAIAVRRPADSCGASAEPGGETAGGASRREEADTYRKEHAMKRTRKHAWALLGGVALLGVLVAAVMWLWNLLIPEIIGWKHIGYWQALGLVVLTHLLLGHLGRPSLLDSRHRRLHEAMHGMSRDEKREFIRRRMRSLYRREAQHDDTTAE